ncbi:MAG: hypothetical protein ACREDT_05565 [Methylocella sp.]
MDEAERLAVIDIIAADPQAGDLIPPDWHQAGGQQGRSVRGGAVSSLFSSIRSSCKIDDASRFRLDIVLKATGATAESTAESYVNLSQDPADSRYVKAVLNDESGIVTVTKTDVTKPVTAKTIDINGGVDGPVLQPSDADFDTGLMGDGVSTGVFYLDKVDLFNLLNVPGYANITNLGKLETFCRSKRALLLVDSDKGTTGQDKAMTGAPDSSLTGDDGINASFYYPWLLAPDPQ